RAVVTCAGSFSHPPPPPPPPPPPDPPPPPEKPDEPDETGTALASALLTPAIDDETELLKLLLDQLPEPQPAREWAHRSESSGCARRSAEAKASDQGFSTSSATA